MERYVKYDKKEGISLKNTFIYESLEGLKINKIPDQCPFCHVAVNPRFIRGYALKIEYSVDYRTIFSCTSSKCLELFIAYYSLDEFNFRDDNYYLRGCGPFKPRPEEFEESISSLSPSFVEIYNQAKQAEERDLNLICGVGYRKALEFLIKDYAISINPEAEEEVKKEFLRNVIKKNIQNERIREISKRAVWIGNDETHYVRRIEDKDIEDLKILIKISLNWINMEILSNRYEQEIN